MAEKAEEPKGDPPPKEDEPKNPPGGIEPGKEGGGQSDEKLSELVKAEVAKVLGNQPGGPPPARQSLESLAEAKVRDAVKVLRLEEENQRLTQENASLKTPEERKESKEVVPKKVRRLTKALWGNPDDE